VKHFELIDSGVDVAPLLAEIEAHPELWDQRPERLDAPESPHAQMADIWLRYNDIKPYLSGEKTGDFGGEHVPVWYPAYGALRAVIRPIIFDLMGLVEGEMLGGVLITKIPHGCEIKPHVDKSWHVDYFEKFYVTLKSAPGAVFGCESEGETEELSPKVGEIWLFDNHKTHWVMNQSGQDRITLIICIRRGA
jgi:hypothetical protein